MAFTTEYYTNALESDKDNQIRGTWFTAKLNTYNGSIDLLVLMILIHSNF